MPRKLSEIPRLVKVLILLTLGFALGVIYRTYYPAPIAVYRGLIMGCDFQKHPLVFDGHTAMTFEELKHSTDCYVPPSK